MQASELAASLTRSRLVVPGAGTGITGITNDSRRVTPGALYAALRGLHVDGHSFIHQAVEAGATAVVCEELPPDPTPGVAWFVAPDARRALSELSDRYYGRPSQSLFVVGVTGTDGKTSTVSFIHQLLNELTGRSAYLSSAGMQTGAHEEPNRLHQSTPEAPEVHRVLRRMLDEGARYAVLESTSHGLSHKTCRLVDVRYRAAVFTNLSHEHLEFHGTFERYRDDKANLFRALDESDERAGTGEPARDEPPEPFGVVNRDDPHAAYFEAATGRPVVGYATASAADYRARDLALETVGTQFTLVTPRGSVPCRLPVPGGFNVLNALAAAATVQRITGCGDEALAQAIGRLRPVRGRMHVMQESPFSVVVDFAHTPGSFENVLPFFREKCAGRLIVVFGSAGERDPAKRPLQGAIADRYADLIVLADEDPRGEDRMQILRDIAAGCPGRSEGGDLLLVPDRRTAVREALGAARPGDTVLLLGKGHETSIIGATGAEPWDEATVAAEELATLGHEPTRRG